MEETSSPTAVLQDLKDLGVRLMLDDFGTGYSSLNHVKRFPIEAIKVDRAFCAGVVEDEGDRHILRAIVSMASAMNVAVVAEGVEGAEQARWLRHLGIGLAQGYAFGRPAPASAMEALLRDGLPLDRLALAFEPLTDEPAVVPAPPRGLTEPTEPAAAGGATVTLGEAAEALGDLHQHRAPLGRHRPHPGRAHERRPPPLPRLRAAAPERRGRLRDPPRGAPGRAPHRAAGRLLHELLGGAAGELAAAVARGLYDGPPGLVRERPRPRAARHVGGRPRRRMPQRRLRRRARGDAAPHHPRRPRRRDAASSATPSSSASATPRCARCPSAAPPGRSSSARGACSTACARSCSKRPTRARPPSARTAAAPD